MSEKTKTCTRCGKVKPSDAFGPDPTGKCGKKSRCKSCLAEIARDRYSEDPEQGRALAQRYRDANREQVNERARRFRDANREQVNAQKRNRYATDGGRRRSLDVAWRKTNLEHVQARDSAYYQANKDRMNTQSIAWRKANPERAATNKKIWDNANKERIQAYHRAWREANKERDRARAKAWLKANPGFARGREQRRRFRKNGNGQPEIFRDLEIFNRDRWICGICGELIDATLRHPDPFSVSLDHIVPLNKGGKHTRDNVQAAHLACNSRKGDRPLPSVNRKTGAPNT